MQVRCHGSAGPGHRDKSVSVFGMKGRGCHFKQAPHIDHSGIMPAIVARITPPPRRSAGQRNSSTACLKIASSTNSVTYSTVVQFDVGSRIADCRLALVWLSRPRRVIS